MPNKFLLFFILLSLSLNQMMAQSDYLDRIDAFLIGPNNVDLMHNTQSEYYIEKYQLLKENISIERKENQEEILQLDKKKFNRKKTVEEIAYLKESIEILDAEIEKIDRYLNLWSIWEQPEENVLFLKSYDAKKCYQIDGQEFSYFPTDYRIDTLGKGSHIYWNEKIDQVMLGFEFELVEVEPAGSKWVKKRAERNCLSADPNDCLVWCMQETPAVYDTLVIQEAVLGCVDGFNLEKGGEQCERTIISEDKVEAELQVKLMDDLTDREIRVKKFEIVKCN